MENLGEGGRYELRARIGKGAISSVHEAMDLRRRAPVIVKRFAPSANLKAYTDVVAALKRADVPGVMLPQELVLSRDPVPFAVYPVVAGESLESAIRGGAMQWARAAAIVSGCAAILAAVAKATRYTHRALKPGNVWLTPEGAPRILDFGRVLIEPSEPVRRGELLFEYRAPEQLEGPGDARADVFTLAVLLVELTSGLHPFSGTTAFHAAHKLTQTPPDLTQLTRGMSSAIAHEVATHVRRALAADIAKRPEDVRTFAATLDYQRPRVGAPDPVRPAQPVAPNPPALPVEDPSTVMQLPNMWQRLQRSPAGISPPIDPGTPGPPTDLAPQGEPTTPESSYEHVQEDMSRSPGASELTSTRREVGPAAAELDAAPLRSPSAGPPSAFSRQPSRAVSVDPADRTEHDIPSPGHASLRAPYTDDRTEVRPLLRPVGESSADRGARRSDDATEIRTWVLHEGPSADGLATVPLPTLQLPVALTSGVTPALSALREDDTTLQLPDAVTLDVASVRSAPPVDDATLQLPDAMTLDVAPVRSAPPADDSTLQLPDAVTPRLASVRSAPPRAVAPAALDLLTIRALRGWTVLIGLSMLCLLVLVIVVLTIV